MEEDGLAAARREIDRIDGAMHDLLMERASVIGRLVAAKSGDRTGTAFRPDREAEVLRNLASRHRGGLPLDAVEAIWRVLMSAFVFVQAPFAVHADSALGADAMRDSARFHFGFSPPFHRHGSSAAAVEAVSSAPRDLGLLGIPGADEPWWERLAGADAPKIVAQLPFLERPRHPAPTRVLVIARADLPPPSAQRADAFSVRLRTAVDDVGQAIRDVGWLAQAGPSALLLTAPGVGGRPLAERLRGLAAEPPVRVGSFPLPYVVA